MRESVLMTRLRDILDKLIILIRTQKHPSGGVYQPSDGFLWAIRSVIRASHLNTFHPALSIQHKFDGKLRRQKEGRAGFQKDVGLTAMSGGAE